MCIDFPTHRLDSLLMTSSDSYSSVAMGLNIIPTFAPHLQIANKGPTFYLPYLSFSYFSINSFCRCGGAAA